MRKEFSFHDYDNCLVNLSNSVLNRFGVKPLGKTLPSADRFLKKGYRNVVVLLLDGLGTCILEGNLNQAGFLRTHYQKTFSSVFPPTTVAATTSVLSGLQPIESAWLGWDCYYPQVNKNVTVFFNTEQGTDMPVSEINIPWETCGYESVVDRLVRAGKKAYQVTPFAPPYPQDFAAICECITELCKEDGDKYIYAYWNEPDSVMHEYGCYSKEAKRVIAEIEETVAEMSGKLKDTLLIVTADHGQLDGRNVSLTDYPDIMDCLVRLPSIEPRALNLFVKEDKRAVFEQAFQRAFGKDFILLTKEEVYETNLFGYGTPHKNVNEMLGDYLAVSITDLTLFNTKDEAEKFKGVHAGYTKDELEIPLIVIEKKGNEHLELRKNEGL